MDILAAAKQLRPGTDWNLRGDRLEQADDGNPRVAPPTMEELNAVLSKVAYRDDRAKAYPAIGDQLDAIWKLFANATDSQAMAVKQSILDVKAQFPKPQ